MGRNSLTPSELKAKKIISANLNDLLLKSGKKKIELQRETNIPRSTLSDYFGGKTLPSVDNLQKLAKAFNVSVGNIDPRYNPTASKEASPTKTTYKDLGLPYKGVVPDDVNAMYRAIAETYAKEHNLPKRDE